MYAKYLFLWALGCLAHGKTILPDKETYIDLKTNKPVTLEKACIETPCIVKCCRMNQILLDQAEENSTTISCISHPEKRGVKSPFNYSDKLPIYNKDLKKEIIKTNKTLMDFKFLFHEKFSDISNCCMSIFDEFEETSQTNYLTEDGRLMTTRQNFLDNWLPAISIDQFCFENLVRVNETGHLLSATPRIALYGLYFELPQKLSPRVTVPAYSMLVSCCFMILVLAVYCLLKELQNLAGMMLMAYLSTLTAAFLIRAVQVFGNNSGALDENACIVVGLLLIYTLVASFTWMNVMSFDIWWSMRGFRKSRQINRRGIPVKFAWYCLYAWGVPLIPTLFIIIVEHLDLRHIPAFVKPHLIVETDGCFIPEEERQLYLNGPIAICTFINIALFLMTAYNIWRIKSGVVKSADSKRNKKDETRFGIYLKLSMVMGVSWILEVLSSLVYPDSKFWYISDVYNTLVGLFIFIIFVCKKNVLRLLCKSWRDGTAFSSVANHEPDYKSKTDHLSRLQPLKEFSRADEL